MSQNDVIAFDANFQKWTEGRGSGLSDPFLYYSIEHLLKAFDPTDEDLREGIMDKKGDGGVDAIYFLVDREFVHENTDLKAANPEKTHLAIFQTKGDEGYSPTALDKLLFFTDDLLDLARQPDKYHTKYHSRLLDFMRVFKEKYRLIAGAFPTFTIEYYYVVRKDAPQANDDALMSAATIEAKATEHFNKCSARVRFVNIQTLLEYVQIKPSTTGQLVWIDHPVTTTDGYLGLVTLPNYYRFIQDANGGLSRRIFEANVRGFQGTRPVNNAILDTLKHPLADVDFWFLNNGVTVVASDVTTAGKNEFTLANPSVVNGLQTSRLLYDYVTDVKPDLSKESRCILVRVIKTNNVGVRDAIINATNSQNRMPGAALRATEKIQRQIEDLFPTIGLFYDRRPGYYKDEGRSATKIVTMTEVAQGMLATVFQRPNDARARPGDYISNDAKYAEVFGDNRFPLNLYLVVTQLLRIVEAWLARDDPGLSPQEQRNVKFYALADLVCSIAESAEPTADDIVNIDLSSIDDAMLTHAHKRARGLFAKIDTDDQDGAAKGVALVAVQQRNLRRRFPASGTP